VAQNEVRHIDFKATISSVSIAAITRPSYTVAFSARVLGYIDGAILGKQGHGDSDKRHKHQG
jgi:hypothetical protein